MADSQKRCRAGTSEYVMPCPGPPILVFFDCLAFFRFLISLLWGVFSFQRFSGFRDEKNPCFFRVFPLFYSKKQGSEGQGYGVTHENLQELDFRVS